MWNTNMFSNIKVYQKYLVTSIKVGCATCSLYMSSVPKSQGVPTNNQSGRGSNTYPIHCLFRSSVDDVKMTPIIPYRTNKIRILGHKFLREN